MGGPLESDRRAAVTLGRRTLLRSNFGTVFPIEGVANRLVHAGHVVAMASEGRSALLFAVPAAAVNRIGIKGTTLPTAEWQTLTRRLPRIAIYRGRAASYPYYAWYAHSLTALGFDFAVVDGPDVANGALEDIDILVLPGGFAIWGLDRCESLAGIDEAIRRFSEHGGGTVGSCGGAFYLSSGRPGWLGIAQATPRYTHEYLRGGAGIVSLAIADGPLSAGLPSLVEMPYYHGPIYQSAGDCEIAARFASLTLGAHIPIDNPLDEDGFERTHAGLPAILTAGNETGRAVLFSTHPEMGDLVRKYVSVSSYIARYLPIRGSRVMEETLDFYQPNNAPSFRLLFNAVRFATPDRTDHAYGPPPADRETDIRPLADAVSQQLAALALPQDGIGALLSREKEKLAELAARLSQQTPISLTSGLATVLNDTEAFVLRSAPPDQRAEQRFLDLELALRLVEVAARRSELDGAFSTCAAGT